MAASRSSSNTPPEPVSTSAGFECPAHRSDPGEAVIGEGFVHPRHAERERHRNAQLETLGPEAATTYLRRS